ncbi:hypothetical protein AAE478_001904 [Parahypoxylon ruwenzoriense]
MSRTKKGRPLRLRRPSSNTTPDKTNIHAKPFAHFSNFVHEQERRYVGKDMIDNSKPYIPHQALRAYWTKPRISQVQNAYNPPLAFNIDSIRDHYIRIFSTLVYCREVGRLEEFTKHSLHDDRLPLKGYPREWFRDPHSDSVFSKIFEHQWLFFPLIFTPTQLEDHHLDDKQVLPIIELSHITSGDAAIVQKITIDGSCNFLVKQDERNRPTQNTFALKTYHRSKHEKRYDNEVRALGILKNSTSRNVITYYGSFRYHATYNILFEYADGGNLAEFLQNTPPPKGAKIVQFWKSLSQCFKGLDHIHRLTTYAGDSKVNGIHEDIKPENILLFKGSSTSPYDFTPKIADFGLFTHVKESKTSSSDAMGLDKVGNQLYSSPECSHISSYQENGPNMISPRADIFSLGAVLSDVCAWMKGGAEEKHKYLEKRRAYHETLPRFRGSDYKGCFHDGVDRLEVVDEMHGIIRRHCRFVDDRVTPLVIDMIEKHMLLTKTHDRYNAKQLSEIFTGILDSPTHRLPELLPINTVSNTQASSRPQGPSLETLGDKIAEQQSISGRRRSEPRNSIDAEIKELAEDLKINVPDRHHLFFIDDSTSMLEHQDSVYKSLRALLYLTKHLDDGNLELSFASDPKRLYRKHNVERLAHIAARHGFRRQPHVIESCFSRLVDDVIIPHLPIRIFGINFKFFARKPTSIYIFTDGNWGDNMNVRFSTERPMNRLRDELGTRCLDKNHISFHFIRFGNSESGERNLNYLDHSGRDKDWDNVDVKPVSSPVNRIVIGPISEVNDDLDEE